MKLEDSYKSLRTAGGILGVQNAAQKNLALKNVAAALNKNRSKILEANSIDVKNAREKGTSESLIDRLSLNDSRIDSIIESLNVVILQNDPVGEELSGWKTPAGLLIRQVRVPIGVVAIIYESRPNVTVDAFALAYKSGNSILLRGSSSAYNSNKAIVEVIKDSLSQTKDGVPEAIELVENEGASHDDVNNILTAVGKIDVVLPRGGKKLIQNVVSNAKVPVIETGSGVCHLYIDESADMEKAVLIAENAKIQRPSVCNAIECIVVNSKVAAKFLPMLAQKFANRVKLHADERSFAILKTQSEFLKKENLFAATDADFGNEYLDYECCIKTVDSLDEAVSYINSHNTHHSESIITESRSAAVEFQNRIDAACVYVNASTRFTDGGEFGFGAELGISTQKLHVRGPMGIRALTTTKYLIDGDGHIR